MLFAACVVAGEESISLIRAIEDSDHFVHQELVFLLQSQLL